MVFREACRDILVEYFVFHKRSSLMSVITDVVM